MKTNPKPWLYGPDWQGQRCEAQTRRGTPCQRPARLTAARTKHGLYTKEKRAEARRFAEQGRQMRGELKELEEWFVDHGHLDKKWRDWFK